MINDKLDNRLIEALTHFRMYPIPAYRILVQQVRNFQHQRYGIALHSDLVTDKAVCSYIRHGYTNYESILRSTYDIVGSSPMYELVKIYLCCKIVKRYKLKLNPVYAATGTNAYDAEIADSKDVEGLIAFRLGIH